jgi:rhodanese-related sulfurtransferase
MRVTKLMLVLCLAVSGIAHAHTEVNPATVKAMMDAGGALTIVDVREEYEYCDSTYSPPGHIPGAINMPWYSGYLEDHYAELPLNEDLVVVCRSGNRSHSAANFLDSQGFISVFDMVGGMNAWNYETELCPQASVTGPGGSGSAFFLEAAGSNPFPAEAEIRYALPAADRDVQLAVYDTHGRIVSILVDHAQSPGVHRTVWRGTDGLGNPVASGIYFARLTWNGESLTQRLVLAR